MRCAAYLALGLVLGCSKTEPPPPERTEPWPAQPPTVASVASGPEQRVRYGIDARCQLAVELPAKAATPRGVVRVARGALDVDLMNLERTRGTLDLDVASIAMEGSEGDGGAADPSAEARAWLEVGDSRPEAERERLRWATFAISSLSNASARAAHEGKRQALPAPTDADGAVSDAAVAGEERMVTATVSGTLSLHGFRVEQSLRARALFRYSAPAVAGAVPSAIRIEIVRAVPVSLVTHDIKPRDAAGTFLAKRTKELGVRVGKEARVTGWVAAALAPPAPALP
jgi:hypothetical protein